jgi:histidinol-phosphate phosphatase family protein
MTLQNLIINPRTVLFVDRDGVINRRLPGTYVKKTEEFEFLEGVLEAFKIFDRIFFKIFVVTNQQGIGKGYMTEQELTKVHQHLLTKIQQSGGRIDRIYHAPQLATLNPPMRKPNTGMALAAKRDFPHIDLSNAIMVGDSKSDMQFGNNAGMQNVFIHPHPLTHDDIPYILHFEHLIDFARFIKQNKYSSQL